MTHQINTDVLVLGSGAAGLSLALQVAANTSVAILAKSNFSEGSSLYAQGGVAAVANKDKDSFESHIEDTKLAGAGLCRQETVEQVVRHGPAAIDWLIKTGVAFTTNDDGHNSNNSFHLTREGGHSHRRVFHAADATGLAIENTLEAQARAHKNISIYEGHIAVDLITQSKLHSSTGENACLGAYVLNRATGQIQVFSARHVVLATGGAAKVYLYTSNPDTSTGDGIAMAWRAGCRVGNMEFVQFHPTCLYHPKAKSFLITEAVRGEGGELKLINGKSFASSSSSMANHLWPAMMTGASLHPGILSPAPLISK
jgi:L-aspartate oxidase